MTCDEFYTQYPTHSLSVWQNKTRHSTVMVRCITLYTQGMDGTYVVHFNMKSVRKTGVIFIELDHNRLQRTDYDENMYTLLDIYIVN